MSEKSKRIDRSFTRPDPREYRGGYQPTVKLPPDGSSPYPAPPKGGSSIQFAENLKKQMA